MAGSFHIAAMITAVLASTAMADPAPTIVDGVVTSIPKETPPELPPPPTWKGDQIDVVEKLGASVPLAAKFRRHDGAVVTLGEVLSGEMPTILTFNYSDCPMLCSLQLNGFTAALPTIMQPGKTIGADKDVAFHIGAQFQIVTISLEPNETVERIAKMRQKYLDRLPAAARARADKGWTFLVAEQVGQDAQIRRVAESVGFKYLYLTEKMEWAHPAALIFLSTKGVVTRYVYGIEYPQDVLRESIFRAGLAEPTTASGFMHRCYNFDPSENDHSRQGVMALRIGAASFLVLMMGGFGFYFFRRSSRSRLGRATPGSPSTNTTDLRLASPSSSLSRRSVNGPTL